MKKLLKVVLVLIILIILGVIVMWLFDICPPEGPWPPPPWCEESDSNLPSLKKLINTYIVNYSAEEEWEQPQEYLDMISDDDWIIPEEEGKIVTGHSLLDIYNTYLLKNRYDSTLISIKENNASWVVYDNYNAYYQIDPPVIGEFPNRKKYSMRDATTQEIGEMIEIAHENGIKFALMTELNYDVAMDNYYSAITGDASIWDNCSEEEGWERVSEFAGMATNSLIEMGEGMDNPTQEQDDYWDLWFKEYSDFIIEQAQVAEEYQADMLVIGKQLMGAINLGNTDRWKALIGEVRSIYSGPISYAGLTDNHYSQFQDCGFIEDLDYITIFMYNEISEKENPSIEELKASFETIIDNQADYYYKEYGKKSILLTPFQSRDYGAKQVWFESTTIAPEVEQDLLIQAKLYEALFQALEDEESVEMVWSWGYWWLENNFVRYDGAPTAFEKSSSVRNKPAAEIFRRWSLLQ